jgi:prepilin-type N-terminal cleavage/methylation domain-containing protein/prepilin-type processing-associated H-X9-DG protein
VLTQNPLPDSRTRRGFTLVELLVVILIIAALAAITIVMVSRIKRQANSAKAVQGIRQTGSALLGLVAENGGAFPKVGHYPSDKDPATGLPYQTDGSWDLDVLKFIGVSDIKESTPPQVPTGHESMLFHGNDDQSPAGGPFLPTARRTWAMLKDLGGISSTKVLDPTRTAMLGERPWSPANQKRAGFRSCAELATSAMVKNPKTKQDLNPGGKFNFVFVDGHIETLSVKESYGKGSLSKPGGIWTPFDETD